MSFTENDFYFLRKEKKLCKKTIEFFNTFFTEQMGKWQNLISVDEKIDKGSYQSCLDKLEREIEKCCCNLGFKYTGYPNQYDYWDTIDEGLVRLQKWNSASIINKLNSVMELYYGSIQFYELYVAYSVLITAEIQVNGETEIFITFYNKYFCDKTIKLPLREWKRILPLIKYCIEEDYSKLRRFMDEVQMSFVTEKKRLEMNKNTMELYIQALSKKFNLSYRIEEDNRGVIILFRLPKRLCLRLRVKLERFASDKDEIERVLKQALDFADTQKIRASIKYYASSDLWMS